MRIKLTLGGKEYVTDVAEMTQKVTIGEIRTIKHETGMTPAALQAKLLELKNAGDSTAENENWDVYTALVYLVMSRSGGHVTWADVERIPLVDLASGFSIVEDEPPAEVPLGELTVVNG